MEIGTQDGRTERTLARIVRARTPEPGFMGAGHEAVMVVSPADFARNDPFIALMDDRVEPRDGLLGGAHPHAGFETVTFMLDGTIQDRDEGPLHGGDVLWMTAGRGVVHNEEVRSVGRVRLLQLWLTLAKDERDAPPRFERIEGAAAPAWERDGAHVRLYSGATLGLVSPTLNHVPVVLADVRLAAHADVALDLPASHGGFAYVVGGRVRNGDTELSDGDTGWLDAPGDGPDGVLGLSGGDGGGRVILYAGRPTGDPIVVQGPFVADSRPDITRAYNRYLSGEYVKMSELAERAAGV